ncbi:Spindle and kinetochore-associated protein 3 [Liparis tanakae]|uniref:Spindle and kinetochore-associated protein 3 n=1 Tax=Liparis tanakae TaxID=230148 RepID=A0A4Z2FT13_9TELE|nr:Spindle and kinetochore-associated protein 3 [Liparis tanakae]
MEPTARFFSKLRKMALTLESETAKLQSSFENRDEDDGDGDATAKASRAYHDVRCDVGGLKTQIQGQLSELTAQQSEAAGFIEACRVMARRVATDNQTLRGHWEKYGYQAPRDPRGPAEAEEEAVDDGETGEDGGGCGSSPPLPGPPPFADALRTPQLSDFGLSKVAMKRALAGAGCGAELSPMPRLHLPCPFPATPTPLTPKCALRMDDDEPRRASGGFGLPERGAAFPNNDFTMDLLRKNADEPQRPLVPPGNALGGTSHTKGTRVLKVVLLEPQVLESPEPPVFCTPGLKITKPAARRSPPAQSAAGPQSPARPAHLPTTPEPPVLQTPYLSRLGPSRKNALQPEPTDTEADRPSPRDAAASVSARGRGVPDVGVTAPEDSPMPEMPVLESVLGISLQTRSAGLQRRTEEAGDQDGPTQEFRLGTPRLPTDYQELGDLGSVTQDICKTEFSMKDLSRACATGTKTPLYVLCLVELRRLEPTEGARSSGSLYKLCTDH